MKIYKVDNWTYIRSNSLLPHRMPTPPEEAPTDAAVISPVGHDLIDVMIALGWTPLHAENYYRSLFTYYWYTIGLHDVAACNAKISAWVNNTLAPTVRRTTVAPPHGLPPQVVFFAVVVGIILVVVLLVAPEWDDPITWTPPCNVYLGIFEDQLWWMHLVSVSPEQRPLYRAVSYSGGIITAHTYEFILPPVVTDRFHFWGTINFQCWQIPWFRKYRVQWADTTHIGLCYRVAGDIYGLKEGYTDPFLPVGPVIIPPADYCLAHSPCHA